MWKNNRCIRNVLIGAQQITADVRDLHWSLKLIENELMKKTLDTACYILSKLIEFSFDKFNQERSSAKLNLMCVWVNQIPVTVPP